MHLPINMNYIANFFSVIIYYIDGNNKDTKTSLLKKIAWNWRLSICRKEI